MALEQTITSAEWETLLGLYVDTYGLDRKATPAEALYSETTSLGVVDPVFPVLAGHIWPGEETPDRPETFGHLLEGIAAWVSNRSCTDYIPLRAKQLTNCSEVLNRPLTDMVFFIHKNREANTNYNNMMESMREQADLGLGLGIPANELWPMRSEKVIAMWRIKIGK